MFRLLIGGRARYLRNRHREDGNVRGDPSAKVAIYTLSKYLERQRPPVASQGHMGKI